MQHKFLNENLSQNCNYSTVMQTEFSASELPNHMQ